MTIIKELAELSPSIIKYPIEKIVKAIVNITLSRKVSSSIGRLIAASIGIGIGIYLPNVSQVGVLLAYLALDLNLSAATALTLSTVVSAWICCSFCIYITKSAFQSYYFNKYGVTNPEHRLTENDKRYIYNNNLDKTDEEINKLIFVIEKRIDLVVVDLQRLKQKENVNAIQHLKLVLNKLKKGDLEFFDEYYDIGITTETRQRKRYDYSSNRLGRLSSDTDAYQERRNRRIANYSDAENNDRVDASSTILRSFNHHMDQNDCQDTPSFDILAVNKSRI